MPTVGSLSRLDAHTHPMEMMNHLLRNIFNIPSTPWCPPLSYHRSQTQATTTLCSLERFLCLMVAACVVHPKRRKDIGSPRFIIFSSSQNHHHLSYALSGSHHHAENFGSLGCGDSIFQYLDDVLNVRATRIRMVCMSYASRSNRASPLALSPLLYPKLATVSRLPRLHL
jgi:hypothetical protein